MQLLYTEKISLKFRYVNYLKQKSEILAKVNTISCIGTQRLIQTVN